MPSDSRNSTMAKATGLIFCCLTLLQPKRCLLPYHCTCNAFFMDFPRPSFVYHWSLFTTKSVDLVVGTSIRNFQWLLWLQKFFLNSCWFVLLHNGLNVADEVSSFQAINTLVGRAVRLFQCSMHGFTSNNKAVPYIVYFNHLQSIGVATWTATPPGKDRDTLIEQSVTQIKAHRIIVVYEKQIRHSFNTTGTANYRVQLAVPLSIKK